MIFHEEAGGKPSLSFPEKSQLLFFSRISRFRLGKRSFLIIKAKYSFCPYFHSLFAGLQLLQQLSRRLLPITLRVILGPPPQIVTGINQRPLRNPSQLLIGTGRVAGQVQHVPVTAGRDFVWEIAANGVAKCLHHLEDGASLAGSEVPCADTGLLLAEVVEGLQVAGCKVEDVDVIADGGSVVGFVVCQGLER